LFSDASTFGKLATMDQHLQEDPDPTDHDAGQHDKLASTPVKKVRGRSLSIGAAQGGSFRSSKKGLKISPSKMVEVLGSAANEAQRFIAW
jgi:hypothetical protein